jgi:hypothetical protein
MKALLRPILCALVALATAVSLHAQELVSTGLIQGIQPQEGTITLRSDQTQNTTTFFGVDKAQIFSSDGQPMALGGLQLGTRVTINFAQREGRMYVQKIITPPAAPAVKSFPVNVEPSNSRASMMANDGDITTHSDKKRGGEVERVRMERGNGIGTIPVP